MSAKYLLVGTLILGVVIFLWGAVTHSLLPAPLKTFTNGAPVVAAVHANTPSNGVYLDEHGVFAAVSFTSGMEDKTQNLAPYLVTQFVTDTFSSFILLIVIAQLSGGVVNRATWSALAGVAAFGYKIVPCWTWYGFSSRFIGMEALDLIGKFFIGGLVAAALWRRWGQAASRRGVL